MNVSKATRLYGEQFRRGLLVALNGVSLWFLAVLATAYLSGSLPWQSTTELLASFWAYTVELFSLPVSLVDVVAYLGIALTVFGPSWYWMRPWLSASGDRAGATEREADAAYFGGDDPTERGSGDSGAPQAGSSLVWLSRIGLARVGRIVKPILVFGAVPVGVVVLLFVVTEFGDVSLRLPIPGMSVIGGTVGSFVLFFVSLYLLFRVIG